MPVLQLDDQQFPLKTGANRIGAGADADVVVPGYSVAAVDAIVDAGSTPTIRRASGSSHVLVNGVLLGPEPTPLVHGDRLEVAGRELRYADDAKNGATQFFAASEIAALTGARRSGTARATTASGGRIVSLVDGKEYGIPADGLVFGRDAACDVVVPQAEVSRRHAEILPEATGYFVKDISSNGVFVNGERVQGEHLLARADIVRIGSEEFRFYADVAPSVTPRPIDSIVIPPSIDEALVPPPPAPPARHAESRPALAELEMLNEGPTKGTRYDIRSPLTHIGRGAHNDVELHDESVSDSHAKLQRRDDGWYVVDMESTNGTYLGGIRIAGERRIDGSPDIRFGGLKFRFTVVGDFDADAKGSRTIAAMRPPAAAGRAPAKVLTGQPMAKMPSPPEASTPVAESEKTGGTPTTVWVVIGLAVVTAVAFFLLKG